ncbi:lysozyme inhibitor LprI family protein [Scleromatobacter humisilvae]|uniref:Lysozyme inhibitor LprI family protein n=1 Tax=Scleromatobacter humisilvae TaxID=2897159 RepID=A0A9X1YM73_9BURK|nr:lysozyme inhibitor LprI family protein [Scleromatobacter humisilvae]MCK9688688.1 lysozyme inhibitor LprI family protein [Scleromatobacter humisilvae]
MSFDIQTVRASARASVAFLACTFASLAHAADGPSFDCARVTSHVNKTICASPELSALDRQLAAHYRALLAQSGGEAPALQREEAQWLREVRDPCPDAACIAQAYALWDAVLVARSRRLAGGAGAVAASASPAAPNVSARTPPNKVPDGPPHTPSPAAAAETQAFAVDAGSLADARALRGKACAPGEDVPQSAGFVPVAGELPIIYNGSVVLVRRHLGADFAFLLDTRRNTCRMVDVVALPPHAQVSNLLQCTVPDTGSATPLSIGVGLRRPGVKAPLAYWEVDVAQAQFIRQPLGVLDWSDKVRCQEAEVGD